MSNTVTVQIASFGFQKSGIPRDKSGNGGGFVFDCRHLPNPGREAKYKYLTGLDAEVKAFFLKRPVLTEYLDDVFRMVDRAVENYNSRGFQDLMVNFGCTGGQHRSVYSAENLATHLREKGVSVIVKHTEMAEIRFKARLAQIKTPEMQ
ncbi:ATP-binding protein [bacterium]|nr:ATP-binding protein [bacterium]